MAPPFESMNPESMSPRSGFHRRRLPRGFTFVEVMVATLLAATFIVLIQGVYTKISVGMGIASLEIGLQSDARSVFAWLSDDVNSANWAFTDDGLTRFDFEQDSKLILIGGATEDEQSTMNIDPATLNPDSGFPYPDYGSDSTVQRFPANRVTYEKTTQQTPPGVNGSEPRYRIFRQVDLGILVRTEQGVTPAGESRFSYQFESRRQSRRRPLAANVTRFDIHALDFVLRPSSSSASPTGSPPATSNTGVTEPVKILVRHGSASAGTAAPPQIHDVAGFAVQYESRDKRSRSTKDEGILQISTKIWMETRTLAYRYETSSSPIDEVLEF